MRILCIKTSVKTSVKNEKSTQTPSVKREPVLGKAFFITPHKLLQGLFSRVNAKKEQTLVLLALQCYGYHTNGYRFYKGIKFKCNRGEYIGSFCHLADITGLSRYTVRKNSERINRTDIDKPGAGKQRYPHPL